MDGDERTEAAKVNQQAVGYVKCKIGEVESNRSAEVQMSILSLRPDA